MVKYSMRRSSDLPGAPHGRVLAWLNDGVRRQQAAWLPCILLLVHVGCSGRPKRIKQPKLDSAATVQRALAEYDQDGDGAIGGAEIEMSPTLRHFDTNGDNRVEPVELTQLISKWKTSRLGLVETYATVTFHGRPLVNASVTFQPDPILGESISPGTGITDEDGTAVVSIPMEERPNEFVTGCRLGVYRVVISKLRDGEETLPSSANTETTLSVHVAPGMNPMISFSL